MSNTLTVRLPKELLDRLRLVAQRTGLPVGRVVRQSLEVTLEKPIDPLWMKYAGTLKGGTGSASVVTADGITVGALVCVNSFGSVVALAGAPEPEIV